MVWGIRESLSFGDFFPDAGYVGWDEEVKEYFENEMSADERAQYDNWDVAYRETISRKFRHNLGPLAASHERPKHLRTARTYTNLASLINSENGVCVIGEDLKDAIESLEPGVHQFWPIAITMPRDKPYPKPYFGMIVLRYLDSFSPKQSEPGMWREGGIRTVKYRAARPDRKTIGGLAMVADVFEGAHLWREDKLRDPTIFMSDALHEEIVRRGLRMPKMYRLREVPPDEPEGPIRSVLSRARAFFSVKRPA